MRVLVVEDEDAIASAIERGLTKQIAVSHEPGDIGDQYNSFLDCEEIAPPLM